MDLQTKEQANEAIGDLNGLRVLGRPVKVGPGVPQSKRVAASARGGSISLSRGKSSGEAFNRWERNDAADHWKGYAETGRRLFVGGLPRMTTQLDVDRGVQELFQGFKV